MSEFNIGDKVIVSLPDDIQSYNKAAVGSIYLTTIQTRVAIANGMVPFDGECGVITDIYEERFGIPTVDNRFLYSIDTDDGAFWWDEYLLAPVPHYDLRDIEEVKI